MIAFYLFSASSVAWFFSMLAGGGSPFILIPLVSVLLGAQAVAPVITIGMLIGNAQRGLLLQSHVDWSLTRWYVPGAAIGALIGCYGLTHVHAEGLQLVLGVGLVVMVLHKIFGPKDTRLTVKAWHFLPYALINAIGSGLIGSTGPVMNPLYFGYGLEKESLVATKAVHKVALHTIKIMAYAGLGTLNLKYITYGLFIGLGAIPANWLGKIVLAKLSTQQFRQMVYTFVAFSGLLMIWQQRSLIPLW
ncbi:sulfite exporter TauE/SafE family protein [Leptolyngbya sp. BL0902]|uniref:sulfite exporter TauE/SafE family protein n=1 Tax=Leptolyngbya sp. BL0902 TaxID=1115757 RepID=UPI0018E786C4|nr:sulfite exporter TauE/SafE family protein [Leptolyngbya sp. BL0902]